MKQKLKALISILCAIVLVAVAIPFSGLINTYAATEDIDVLANYDTQKAKTQIIRGYLVTAASDLSIAATQQEYYKSDNWTVASTSVGETTATVNGGSYNYRVSWTDGDYDWNGTGSNTYGYNGGNNSDANKRLALFVDLGEDYQLSKLKIDFNSGDTTRLVKAYLEQYLQIFTDENTGYSMRNYYDANKNNNLAVSGLIRNPQLIDPTDSAVVTVTGDAVKNTDQPVIVNSFQTSNEERSAMNFVDYTLEIKGDTTLTFEFAGNTLGVLFRMKENINVNLSYSIDGGAAQTFKVSETEGLTWQTYDHPHAFMLAKDLKDTKHTVTFTFTNPANVYLGAILVNPTVID